MTSGRAGSAPCDQAQSLLVPITDQEFALFQQLIYNEAGIYLSQAKRVLLVTRLMNRLQALGLRTFSAYYRTVTAEQGGPAERVRMLDCISTNETHFFREPNHFTVLEKQLIPSWTAMAAAGKRSRRVRVWSAACSTGEEPFSLAMSLLHHLPPGDGWSIEILGTDISTRVLARAEEAIWKIDKASEIPPPYLKAFMLRGIGSEEGKMKADKPIRDVVRFQRLNLNDASYSVGPPFDVIFCRNVLIYFNAESKRRVIDRLLTHIVPDGYLFVGHAESLQTITNQARPVAPTVYQRAPKPRATP